MADAPAAPPAENLPGFKAPTVPTAPVIQNADEGYNNQVAKIEFQLNNQLSGDKATFEDNRKVYEYNKSLLPAKEHEATGIQRFRAATGGWGNSGFQARAQGKLQRGFLDTRTKMQTAYGLKQQGIYTKAQQEIGRRGIELTGAGTKAEQNYFREQNRNKPQTPEPPAPPITAAGGGPPGSRVQTGPGSPQQPLKFGFGEVEAKERREAAARKARKR